MSDLQQAKAIVLDANKALDAAKAGESAAALVQYVSAYYHWHGMHLFNKLNGCDAVANTFWNPFASVIKGVKFKDGVEVKTANQIAV